MCLFWAVLGEAKAPRVIYSFFIIFIFLSTNLCFCFVFGSFTADNSYRYFHSQRETVEGRKESLIQGISISKQANFHIFKAWEYSLVTWGSSFWCHDFTWVHSSDFHILGSAFRTIFPLFWIEHICSWVVYQPVFCLSTLGSSTAFYHFTLCLSFQLNAACFWWFNICKQLVASHVWHGDWCP